MTLLIEKKSSQIESDVNNVRIIYDRYSNILFASNTKSFQCKVAHHTHKIL